MRQIIQLEPHEVARLHKGKTLLISTQAGDVGLQFMPQEDAPKSAFSCDICGVTTGKNGKPFTTLKAVERHKIMTHKNSKRRKLAHEEK